MIKSSDSSSNERARKKRARLYLMYFDIETHLLRAHPHASNFIIFGMQLMEEKRVWQQMYSLKSRWYTPLCVCAGAGVFCSTFITKRQLNVISILLWQIHQFGLPCKMFRLKARARSQTEAHTRFHVNANERVVNACASLTICILTTQYLSQINAPLSLILGLCLCSCVV